MSDNAAASSGDAPASWLVALDDAALLTASSKSIFQRGRTYARSGAVEVMRQESGDRPSVHATVQGTEPYETAVWIDAGEVDGSCDCMSALEGWFCKHQVALALVWRERLSGAAPVVDEEARRKVQASARRAQTLEQRHQALKEFLHARSAAALADRLLDLAERDPDIQRELQQWRKLSEAPQGVTELKSLVTEILAPGRDFISWREGHAYVHRAQAVLDVLSQARSRDPALAATLGLHAMRRGWAALMQADDSAGEVGDLIRSIGDEWVASLTQAGAQPAAFGDTYLQVLLDDPFGCFDTDAAEAALGAAALARFRKALAACWREAKDAVLAERAEQAALLASAQANKRRTPYFERTSESSSRLWTLERMHLRQLEAEGDLDGVLAVMREDLSAPGAYHAITEFLERHGRGREAFANAEQGCKAFADDERLQDDLLRCHDRDGWVAEAFELRRRRFGSRPSVERYREALDAGRLAGRDVEGLRAELHEQLIEGEARELAAAAVRVSLPWRRPGPQSGQRDVSLRVGILCWEGRLDEALELVRPPAHCDDGVLMQLARRLGSGHTARRIELLMRVFDNEMRDSKTPYRRELALVEEIARLLDATRRAAWLAQLRVDYKAKRNFVRDLPPN